jgi:hypothetical protein
MIYMVSNGHSPVYLTTDKETAYEVCRREGTEVLSWPVNVEPSPWETNASGPEEGP